LEARLFRRITSGERFFSPFFRVGFYGKGFENLNGKAFIYRGFELERVAEFVERMQTRFPKSELVNSTDPPSQEILDSDGQHILKKKIMKLNFFYIFRFF
jgi:hypothetical protein